MSQKKSIILGEIEAKDLNVVSSNHGLRRFYSLFVGIRLTAFSLKQSFSQL